MRRLFLALTLALLGWGGSAQANLAKDLTLTRVDSSISAGGVGSLDVLITSNAGYNLSTFSFEFEITKYDNDQGGFLEFNNPQYTNYIYQPSYVFYNLSGGVSGPLTPTNYKAGDTAQKQNPFEQVDVSFTTSVLVRLTLSAANAIKDEVYRINLVADPNYTYFQSLADFQGGTYATYDVADFTGSAGLVTITASTVPEPGTLGVAATGIIAASAWTLSRRRKAVTAA